MFRFHLAYGNGYKPGGHISGTLYLVSNYTGGADGQDIDVGSVSITFSGRTRTSKPSYDTPTPQSSVRLFYYKKVLFTGPKRLHTPHISSPHQRGWDFAFTFPLKCESALTKDHRGGPSFDSDPNQPLPISFSEDAGFELVRGSVEYELKAELLAPGFKGYYMNGSFCQTHLLNLSAPRSICEPSPRPALMRKPMSRQSLDLLPKSERQYLERPVGLRERLGLKAAPTDHLPSAYFDVKVMVPTVAVIGQPLPVTLHVDHDLDKSTTPYPPIVTLTRVTLSLRQDTSICAMQHFTQLFPNYDETSRTSTRTLVDYHFTNQPKVELLDLRTVMDLTIPSNITPTFKTFNIARTYYLHIYICVKCAGRESPISSGKPSRCTFLAKDYEPGLPEYVPPMPAVVDGEEAQITEEPPPPYEAVAQTRLLVPRNGSHGPGSSNALGGRRHRGMVANPSSTAVAASLAASAASNAASSAAASNAGGGGGGGGGC